jgi:hypothetical protein
VLLLLFLLLLLLLNIGFVCEELVKNLCENEIDQYIYVVTFVQSSTH